MRADGQKMLLAIKSMGGESEAAWRALLDDLIGRGLRTPELVVVDGAPGLEKALAALWPDMAVQRCTVHKHRNLLAHAPERLGTGWTRRHTLLQPLPLLKMEECFEGSDWAGTSRNDLPPRCVADL